jgi:hypothetical protein
MAKCSVREHLSVRGPKATFYLSNEAKYNLAILKAELRKREIKNVSESKIGDALLLSATTESMVKALRS